MYFFFLVVFFFEFVGGNRAGFEGVCIKVEENLRFVYLILDRYRVVEKSFCDLF